MNRTYVDTVRLLLQIIPRVFASGRLGLKGGTALNLFVHDMPRLSVDIDAVLLDHTLPREAAIALIGEELRRVRSELQDMGLSVTLPTDQGAEDVKLVVSEARTQVKVEVNQVFRGTLMPVERRNLVPTAEDLFTTSVSAPVLAISELYGSKLVAAFDRQHPRDWFDVMHMQPRMSTAPEIMDAFVAYLAGHNRPVHEVLFPTVKPMKALFDAEFSGMTREVLPLEQLERGRAEALVTLPRMLTTPQRQFLLSLVRAEPMWELLPFPHLQALPAVRWKLQNLQRLRSTNRRKFEAQSDELIERLASA